MLEVEPIGHHGRTPEVTELGDSLFQLNLLKSQYSCSLNLSFSNRKVVSFCEHLNYLLCDELPLFGNPCSGYTFMVFFDRQGEVFGMPEICL